MFEFVGCAIMHDNRSRPYLPTSVGLIGIIAGVVHILEFGAVLVSLPFSERLLAFVRRACELALTSLSRPRLCDFAKGWLILHESGTFVRAEEK
jgi:hypothetical protein